MEKTSMQRLKDRLFDSEIIVNPLTLEEINEYIKLEKQQIIQAVDNTDNMLIKNDIVCANLGNNGTLGEDYYNYKFAKIDSF